MIDNCTIVFRVDSSLLIGSGHLMRCLTFAGELEDNGGSVSFLSRAHQGNLNSLIQRKGFMLYELPAGDESYLRGANRGEYAAWLGATQQHDAEATVAVLKDIKPDWLIVDHYAIGEEWERLVRPYVKKVMVIDDLADRKHASDLLLDQNYTSGEQSRYDSLVSPACTTLLGPEYALLRNEFAEVRKDLKPRPGSVDRVLVFFGGVDPDNVTGTALKALSAEEFSHIDADVVIGAANPHRGLIENLVSRRPRTTLHVQVDNMAELMARADLAICAGGTITWERFCLGLPALVVTIADNQVKFTRDLDQDGFLRWLGNANDIDEMQIREALQSALVNEEINRNESDCGQSIVNGIGAKKVVRYMLHMPK